MNAGSTIADRRAAACTDLLHRVRELHAAEGITRTSLQKTSDFLVELALHGSAIFPDEDFPLPDAHGRGYMLDPAADDGYGLYLTVTLPGKEAAPHDHGIWCVTAGLTGEEVQRFYRRTDDGSRPRFATVEQVSEMIVRKGTVSTMADHDIHSVLTVGTKPARAIALYGYALNRFPDVLYFHPHFNSCRTIPSRRGSGAA